MTEHYVFVDDDEEIKQGDIIRRLSSTGSTIWGLIITADCDIANNKSGDNFTWIKIVRAMDYLDGSWATDQLRRLIEKQSRIAAEGLNRLIKRAGFDLSPLTATSLCDWLL